MRIQTATEIAQESRTIHVLIHGKTGSGKSTWGALCPKPLILLTEPQAIPSIKASNPEALIVRIDSWTQASQVAQALQRCPSAGSGALTVEGRRVETVVTDSLTDLQSLAVAHYTSQDPKTKDDEIAWNRVQAGLKGWLGAIRSLRVSTVGLCLSNEIRDKDGALQALEPQLYGRIRQGIGAWFAAVGYAERRMATGGEAKYIVRWRASDVYTTKALPGWPDVSTTERESLAPFLTLLYGEA